MYLKILTVPLANVFHVPVLSTELASVNATVKKMDEGDHSWYLLLLGRVC